MKSARLALVLLTIAIFFFFFGKNVSFAQSGSSQQSGSILSSDTDQNVPQTLHTQVQSIMIETMSAFVCQLSGIDVIDPKHGCLGIDTKTGKIGYEPQSIQNGGVLGFVNGMVVSTFKIPVSTHEYIAYLSSNFGVGKKAYAQISTIQPGVGLQGLAPVFRIWEAFRNIVYFIFVIILVFVGIGIMFRIQIDPRTVMTIQNQIPKIIIGLILVSISYAIAGLLIDFMWVIIYILFSIFAVMKPELGTLLSSLYDTPFGFANALPITVPILGGINPGGILGIVMNGSITIGDVIVNIITGAKDAANIGGIIGYVIDIISLPGALICELEGIHPNPGIPPLTFPNFSDCLNLGIGTVIGTLGGLIAFFVLLIAILAALFRVWFQLLKSYVFILLDVIFAPFWIVFGLLPGSGMSFGSWLRDIAANILVFPATVLMFLLAYVIMTSFTDSSGTFVPPLVGNPFGASTVIASIIGIGIILMTPEITSMVRGALKSPGFGHIASISTMTGLGGAVVGSTVGGVWGRWWRRDAYGNPTGWLSSYVGNRAGRVPRTAWQRITQPVVNFTRWGTGIRPQQTTAERRNEAENERRAQAQANADAIQNVLQQNQQQGGQGPNTGGNNPTGGGQNPPPGGPTGGSGNPPQNPPPTNNP